jgi:hypothetical protein
MAFPPQVVSGQPIQSAWGNNVIDYLLRREQFSQTVAPPLGGTWPAPLDGTTEWMGINIQAPSWANRVMLLTAVASVRPQAGTNGLWTFKTKIAGGAIPEQYGNATVVAGAGQNVPIALMYSDYFTVAPGYTFRASMVVGASSPINADASSVLRFTAYFTV